MESYRRKKNPSYSFFLVLFLNFLYRICFLNLAMTSVSLSFKRQEYHVCTARPSATQNKAHPHLWGTSQGAEYPKSECVSRSHSSFSSVKWNAFSAKGPLYFWGWQWNTEMQTSEQNAELPWSYEKTMPAIFEKTLSMQRCTKFTLKWVWH